MSRELKVRRAKADEVNVILRWRRTNWNRKEASYHWNRFEYVQLKRKVSLLNAWILRTKKNHSTVRHSHWIILWKLDHLKIKRSSIDYPPSMWYFNCFSMYEHLQVECNLCAKFVAATAECLLKTENEMIIKLRH